MNYSYYSIDYKRAVLSSIWAFVVVNQLFLDQHKLWPISQNSESMLLLSGITLELQISMIVLCLLVPEKVNTWANLVIASCSITMIFALPQYSLSDHILNASQLIGLGAVIWFACVQEGISKFVLLLTPPIR